MMKNTKLIKALIVAISCLLLVGVAFGVMAYADTTDGATSVEIEYKNVSYKGAPSLVYYVGTDAPLAENQKVKLLFWNNKNATGLYNEHTADYAKYAASETIIEGKTYQTFLGEGVAPSEVRLNVYARPALVEVDEAGNETVVALGEMLEYSIFEYALEMFNAKVDGTRGTAADDQVEIYKAFLDYAAAIQKKLFTNQYNGVLNEEKLAKVGGWANAYYVVQVNRYIYDFVNNEYYAEGEYTRFSAQNAGEEIIVNSDLYYTKGSNTYAFKTYRDMNGKALNVLREAEGVQIGKYSVFSNVYSTTAQNPGVVEYNVYYGTVTGSYITMDGGQSLASLGGDAKKFWEQYSADGANPYNTMVPSDITLYYYKHTSESDPVEIQYFYTADGSVSDNANDYHYVAVNANGNLGAGNDPVKNPSNYTFIDVDGSDSRVTSKVVKMNSRGYADYVKAPYTAEGEERGNALLVSKHFYDLSDPNKTTYYAPINYQNELNNGWKTSGYIAAKGSFTASADGSSLSALTANGSFNFKNQSPSVIPVDGYNTVHIMEMDFCTNSDQYDASIVQITMNGGGPLKINILINSTDKTAYIADETSPAKKSGALYDANGTKITNGVIAGSKNGTNVVGKKINQNSWYNLRIEYIDLPNDKAMVLYYIDGELVSYMIGGAASSDNIMSSFGFNFATGTRCGNLYVDNVYLATEGNYKPATPEGGEGGDAAVEFLDKIYTYGEGDYHGQGKYFEASAQIDKSHKPANGLKSGNTSIVEEKLSDGTKNFALHMLKTANAGFSASYGVDNPSGNLYIFETDVKVVGSDNTTEWMLKLSFQDSGISSPGDNKEFAMVCILYKNGYWTIGNQSTPLDTSFKFELQQWHNLRLEFNPANDELNVWVNNVHIYQKVGYGRAGSGSDATYAGMSINVRQRPADSKYTEILFDNIYATTEYRDSIGAGANYENSEKYDSYVPTTDGVTVQGTEENKYINNTLNTITMTHAHNRGHQYIFETDIRWNGAAGFESIESSTAKVLEFLMKSGENEIFSINGVSTNAKDSDLMLKIGTVTVATLARDYWMNLRIVYVPHEAEEVEGELVYKATYKILINGAEIYSATVECDPYDTFDQAVLIIDGTEEGVVPSIDVDNSYTAAVYIDDYKQGDNYANSETYKEGKVDGDLTITDTQSFNTKVSIGSLYLFEHDIKWVGGAATIALQTVDGDDFIVYIIPDSENAGYAKLALENDITKAFFTIYNNVWYNVQIVAEDGVYNVSVSGKVRASVGRDLAATCTGAVITVTDGTVVVDNTYASVENKDYLGKGENKDNAINSFTQADKDGTIVYDPNLKDADPDNKYTDAYITVSKSQVVLGKNTAVSDNILKIVGGKAAALHIFESDIIWAGTEWGVESGVAGTDNAPFFTVTLNDADGNAIFTVYAVGIYYVDTVNTTAQFLKLYTSLEDVAEGNAFAYVQAGVAFNLRVEYAASGEYTVFVNNNAAATGVGNALTAMGSVSVALGNNVYDTKVTIKNTCVTSK